MDAGLKWQLVFEEIKRSEEEFLVSEAEIEESIGIIGDSNERNKLG